MGQYSIYEQDILEEAVNEGFTSLVDTDFVRNIKLREPENRQKLKLIIERAFSRGYTLGKRVDRERHHD